MTNRIRIILLVSCGALFVLGLIFVWAQYTCRVPGAQFECELSKIDQMLRTGDVNSTLAYINNEVQPRVGYAHTHFYLHTVGEYAYWQAANLDEALRYADPYTVHIEHSLQLAGFDGYIHGVLSAYFLHTGTPDSFSKLMTNRM